MYNTEYGCMLSHSVMANFLQHHVHGIFQARILERVAISYLRKAEYTLI